MKSRNSKTFSDIHNLRIILPVIFTIILFVIVIFSIMLPDFKESIMVRKKEMIRELTMSAWSTFAYYEHLEKTGRLTRQNAKKAAISHIRALRYGPEMKDYFWINDMHPVMIMHPYRSDLEGMDLSKFIDPNSKHLFAEFVKVVKQKGEGYVNYMWQWKDNPNLIVPKISYVKGFKSWNWIIGTGIYVEDVHTEISQMTKKLTIISLIILGCILLLLCFVVQRSGELRDQSIHDPLTGLFNRRYMEDVMEREIFRAKRHKTMLSFLMIDIDHFKKFNDSYGHEVGDIFLAEVSSFLKKNCRGEDIVFRYGGEEFTLILTETGLDNAKKYAEKLREDIKKIKIDHNNQELSGVTISIGVALFPEHGRDAKTVLEAADKALYYAKWAGRDRVKVAQDSE